MSYLEERRKYIEAGRPLKEKKVYTIPKKSEKRIAKEKAEEQKTVIVKPKKKGWFDIEEAERGITITHVSNPKGNAELQRWFEDRRKELVGTCQCGCGNKSQKKDDTFFKGSCCHIFPKRKFKSVMLHPLNYVERAMFGGCHSIMDDTSMDRWVNFADWEDIKAKFHVLSPLLTQEEKASKFYSHLEKLVLNN
jgi:hypothetical protein